jgi:hypothetical protein
VSGSLGGGQREWLSYERRWQVDAARVANSFVSRAGGGRQGGQGFCGMRTNRQERGATIR